MAAWDEDLLGRKEVAEFLQNLLERDDEIKVINVDSPWGTGKTFFLKNWKQQLEENHAVVYFNAWEKDYTGDPFVSLVSIIKDQLGQQVGDIDGQSKVVQKFKDKAQETFFATAPTALKYIGKSLIRRSTGLDVDGLSAEVAGVVEQASDVAINSIIDDFKNSEKVIEDFEITFSNLVRKAAKCKSGSDKVPVYILIDELDRCRPTYAIELLERVKHYFDVKGCKFVIATDTGQLQHSIKAVYGSGFDSREYLKRFFDLDFSLSNESHRSWVKSQFNIEYEKYPYYLEVYRSYPSNARDIEMYTQLAVIRPSLNSVINKDGDIDLDEGQLIFLALCETFRVQLRGMYKIRRHYKAVIASAGGNSVHGYIMLYMVFLKYADNYLYSMFFDRSVVNQNLRTELENRFSGRNLYFGVSEKNVHDVAIRYREVSLLTKRELDHLLNENFSDEPYMNRLKMDAFNEGSFFRYEKVVNLAGGIK